MSHPAPASVPASAPTSASVPASATQMVTASDLVRHFGVWQDRAVRAPVYVVHRGRPRLVLTSVDLMDALCAPHATAGGGDALPAAALLRGAKEAVIAVDADLRVRAAGAAAAALLGRELVPGTPLAAAWPTPDDFVAAAAGRVAASGTAEALDVPGARDGSRRLSVSIEPLDSGALLFARDVTAEERARDLAAAAQAHGDALVASGAAAEAGISLRGYVEVPAPSLSALTGLSNEALAAARFASLIDMGSRVAVADALEAAVRDRRASALDAALLVNRAEPLPVRIALAPRRRAGAVDGAVAVLIARNAGAR